MLLRTQKDTLLDVYSLGITDAAILLINLPSKIYILERLLLFYTNKRNIEKYLEGKGSFITRSNQKLSSTIPIQDIPRVVRFTDASRHILFLCTYRHTWME